MLESNKKKCFLCADDRFERLTEAPSKEAFYCVGCMKILYETPLTNMGVWHLELARELFSRELKNPTKKALSDMFGSLLVDASE